MNGTQLDKTVQVKIAPSPPTVAPEFSGIADTSRRRSRRRRRLMRFLFLESIALAVLICFVIGGTSSDFARQSLTTPFAVGVLISSAALAIIPVLFFGLPRRHDQLRRYR